MAGVPLGQVPGGESLESIVDARTLVVRQFQTTGTEGVSSNTYRKGFFDRGGRARWVSSSECIISFPTVRQAEEAALAAVRLPFTVLRIGALDLSEQSTYYPVAAEMHEEFKNTRDSSAAKRMIGAALGIKTPKKVIADAKPAAVEDAWD